MTSGPSYALPGNVATTTANSYWDITVVRTAPQGVEQTEFQRMMRCASMRA